MVINLLVLFQTVKYVGEKRHIALDCYHRGNYAYQASAPPASMVQTYNLQSQPPLLPTVPFATHYSYQIPAQMFPV